MSYRDDLEAGRRREEALEEKIAEQQREIAELRRKQEGGASEATTSPTEPVGEPPPESSSSTSVWGRMIAVVLSVALPALGIVGPCVCEAGRRMDQAEREAAAAKDEALSPETNEDGARLMDLDTRLRRAEVRDAEKKGFVLLHVAEWSDERDGSALF